jgi:hypothetical protein
LDKQAFFYTMDSNAEDHDQPVQPVHAPANIEELPPWVPQLLTDTIPPTAPMAHKLDDQINMYLQLFIGANPSPTIQFLRRINWATLPLYWTPIFLEKLPVRVRNAESREAQHRLVEVFGHAESEEVRNDAVNVIRTFTGTKRLREDSDGETESECPVTHCMGCTAPVLCRDSLCDPSDCPESNPTIRRNVDRAPPSR